MTEQNFEVLDIQLIEPATVAAINSAKTSAENSAPANRALKTFTVGHPDRKIKCDILIVGGGVGAVAAAFKLTSDYSHLKVCLTEETDWLGGQMTSQGVCAFDENYLIETSGACRSYQNFRQRIRARYKEFKLSELGKAQQYLNPGTSWVTYLAFEPKFALKIIEDNLSHAISSGALQIFPRTKVVSVTFHKEPGTQLKQVLAINLENGVATAFEPKFCLDATELGDLLPLAKIPYRVGSDSRSDTGEVHAPIEGDKENLQDFTYPFVIDFRPGTKNTIEKPANFDEFNAAGKFSFDGYKMFEDSVLAAEGNRVVPPFWTYRRLIACENFSDPMYPFDIAMINWDSNDLRGYNIIDQKPEIQAQRLALAKSLSLGFLYWLQTAAPRDEGGFGYPELMLRTDVLGAPDGMSKYPYIREARRIIAKKTIVESDVVAAANLNARSKKHDDTLGIGLYPVDIHGRQEVPGAGQLTKPFQIPMSALLPAGGGSILPACKNIGVSHITNGAYRLHPVEWAIGEAQAEVAAYCLKHHVSPEHALSDNKDLRAIQRNLIEGGSPLVWFDDVPTTHKDFAAIQYTVLTGLLSEDENSLHFRPDDQIELKDVVRSLVQLLGLPDTAYGASRENSDDDFAQALKSVQKHGYLRAKTLGLENGDNLAPTTALTPEALTEISQKSEIPPVTETVETAAPKTVSRSQFARWLYAASRHKGHQYPNQIL